MSAHPNIQPPADASRLPMTLPRLVEKLRALTRKTVLREALWHVGLAV